MSRPVPTQKQESPTNHWAEFTTVKWYRLLEEVRGDITSLQFNVSMHEGYGCDYIECPHGGHDLGLSRAEDMTLKRLYRIDEMLHTVENELLSDTIDKRVRSIGDKMANDPHPTWHGDA